MYLPIPMDSRLQLHARTETRIVHAHAHFSLQSQSGGILDILSLVSLYVTQVCFYMARNALFLYTSLPSAAHYTLTDCVVSPLQIALKLNYISLLLRNS